MLNGNAEEKYKDIIDRPHHVSTTRPRMSRADRAAQFSPFAALTGYEAAVEETARLTEEERELTEDMKAEIDEKLQFLSEHMEETPEMSVTYFVPDDRKEGGAYVTVHGIVKEIDSHAREILLMDNTRIGIERIRSIKVDR